MKNIWHIMQKFFYPLLLILIGVVLCAANYSKGTFLTGWDTLQPEFNFPLAFARIFNGVWRTDQGLGALAIHSHMADLPRVAILWISHFFLPAAFLRYAYVFLMLIIGPLGMYYFICKITAGKLQKNKQKAGAFIGGLAYLCNLATLQHFIVPFEMFIACYGALPWLFLTGTMCIDRFSKKHILLLSIAAIAIAPMAYAATLWYATIGGIFLFLFLYGGKRHIKTVCALLLITIMLNAYWLFPNWHALATKSGEVKESKINQLFSQEAFAKNQEFGTVDNAVVLKNFLFDWKLLNSKTGQFEDLMASWKTHLSYLPTAILGYGITILALIGIIWTLWQRRVSKNAIALLPVFLLSAVMLLSGTEPITTIFAFVQKTIPTLGEALRFPFTKFSILLMVPFAVFVGIGFQTLLLLATKKLFVYIATIEATLALLVYFLPAFTGNLIHPAMRVAIPNRYFELFNFFNEKNHDDRVAILPIHSFWNWTYYSWGYQGAGFLQFGIPQPILDRDYDRWSVFNEGYQKEMAYAVYSLKPENIQAVIQKYHIRWVLVDTSVIAPGENKNVTFTWRLPELLTAAGLTNAKNFSDAISVYDASALLEKNTSLTNIPIVSQNTILSYDQTFFSHGNYAVLPQYFKKPSKEERVDRLSLSLTGIPVITQSINASFTDASTASFPFPSLSHEKTYEITITSKNVHGFPLQLCIENTLTKHCELFTRLHEGNETKQESFLLLPYNDYGNGYAINVKNDMIGNKHGENTLESIAINEITIPDPQEPTTPTTIVTNWQAWDQGWVSLEKTETFPFIKIQKHIMLNGWANAWIGETKGTIIFLPQLLEYLGFAVLIVPVIMFFQKK